MNNHITTIEIDEELTIVSIDFENKNGEIVILKMTDMAGNAIAHDLLEEMEADILHRELHQFWADMNADKNTNGKYSIEY